MIIKFKYTIYRDFQYMDSFSLQVHRLHLHVIRVHMVQVQVH